MYFQAVLGASPLRSGVDMLATALLIAPAAFAAGLLVQGTARYRPANALGWALTLVGFGVLSLLRADAAPAQWAGFQVVAALGTGMIVRAPSSAAPPSG